jgi:hypothetical protein
VDVSFGIAGEDETFDTLEELHAHCWNKKTTLEKMKLQIRRRYLWWFRNPIHDTHCAVKWAWQRVFRGWDDHAISNLDCHLGETLGAQLVKLAEEGHVWPGEEWGTVEQWDTDLKRHGEALLAYCGLWEVETRGEEEVLVKAAQEAMHWVAENLGSLWD